MKPSRCKQLRKTPAKSRSGSFKDEPVEVYCRVKPIPSNLTNCLKLISSKTVQLSAPEGVVGYRNGVNAKEIQYTFRQVFDDGFSQKDVFNTVALPLVHQLISGRNGSGKTYTMNGEPHNGGIMPRCIDVIFNTISSYQAKKYVFKADKMNGFEIQDEGDAMLSCQNEIGLFTPGPKGVKTPRRRDGLGEGDVLNVRTPDDTKVDSLDEDNMYAVFITYIEIYNNNVHDLLDDSFEDVITKKLQNKVIREDANRNMYVHGVTEVEVKSPEEAFDIFYKGQRRKKMAHTNLNVESSRSHSIFTIRLVQAPSDALDEQCVGLKKYLTVSQLSLVDLAGSERTNRTKNTGQRLREAGNINNSLMNLRTCLEILRENQQNGTNKMVPYRDSKLTHLFKGYFDGDGQVRMIVCVNPKAEDFDENLHVLKFAEMSQEIQVPRLVTPRQELLVTPSRRKFTPCIKKNSLEEANMETEIKEYDFDAGLLTPIPVVTSTFPSLFLMGPDDEKTLTNLKVYLQQRLVTRNEALEKFNGLYQKIRQELVKREGEIVITKQENVVMKGTLDQERKKVANLETQLGYCQTERNELMKKIEERDLLNKEYLQKIEDLNMLISQKTLDKEKVKEKCVNKIAAAKEKLAREMKIKLTKERDEYQNKMKDQQEKFRMIREFLDEATPKVTSRHYGLRGIENTPTTPLSAVNNQGTLYMPPTVTPSQGHTAKRDVEGKCGWITKPKTAVELNTIFQPSMKKRKSVTKLTDVKDIVNSKTSKYCLTTQEQDTDGELETKLYKGDVIPTTGGGAQVILNDIELLRQLSPTSEVTSRKRSLAEGSNDVTESRCAISIEGHSKRPKS
ncbi:hypothetical protein RUM43_004352 [Polyplax serrata]|uniref:Kinesin-like protein n=1 Tax=Polyplax serrata TaxID=468196 RepID=A0AAN8XLS1_POLSC